MRSGSTVIDGWRSARYDATAQWVVAVRPSSRPAAASTKVPEHTDATRRARRARRATWRTSSGSADASSKPRPPTTTSVSIGPLIEARGRASMTRPPSHTTRSVVAATRTSYSARRVSVLHCENTDAGPVRSSDSVPS